MKRATIVKVNEKQYDVMLGGHLIGSSKSDFDGLFHMHAINAALDAAYQEGLNHLEKKADEAIAKYNATDYGPSLI